MSDGKQVGAFEALLGELDIIAKALPADGGDKVIAAAAGGTGEAGGKKDGGNTGGEKAEGKKEEGEGEELDEDGNPLVKSLTVTINGQEVQAEDGTALVKALIGRIDDTEDVIAKALSATIGIVKKQGEVVTRQAEIIKSLQGDVQKIGNQGNGRKTLLNIHDNASATLAKSENAGQIDGSTFMVKATAAFDAGKITGKDLTFIDVALRNNQAREIDQSLVAKVLA